MRKDFRFGGSGGQGVISLAVLLANAFGVQNNYEVAQTQSYGPAARGGACKAELVISDERIDYVKADELDAFVSFNKQRVNSNFSKNEQRKNNLLLRVNRIHPLPPTGGFLFGGSKFPRDP